MRFYLHAKSMARVNIFNNNIYVTESKKFHSTSIKFSNNNNKDNLTTKSKDKLVYSDNTTVDTAVPSSSNLKLNWKKYLKLLLLIIYLIVPISYFCFGIELNDNIIYRSYLYILNLPLNLPSYFFIYFIIIWQVLALLFIMLDYIKHKYFYEKKYFNTCKFLPYFIKNYISLVNENSDKPELKEAILYLKRKAIKWTIFSLVIVDLVVYLLIN
uniref:Orf212 n=1 Tax=Schizophyllum commune TaxID=5334 RepID=Q94ZJ6_SCHCO|nr:orf212 [Schizophyllum commune]AAK83401.1 orf212 [Schizophyllum commune]